MSETDDPSPGGDSYGLVCEFWIDTDAYSHRDRSMFVAGYEFATVLDHIRHHDGPLSKPIHRENESRVRMACAKFKRTCHIEPWVSDQDPAGTWSFLEIDAHA